MNPPYKPERPTLYGWDELNGDAINIPAQDDGGKIFFPVVPATGFIGLDVSNFGVYEYTTRMRSEDVSFLYEYTLENVNLMNRYYCKTYKEQYAYYVEELKSFYDVRRSIKAVKLEAERQAKLAEEKKLKELATRDEKIANLQRQIDYLRNLK